MSTRTVRLDDDAEATLKTLQKQTGLSISNVLKQTHSLQKIFTLDRGDFHTYRIRRGHRHVAFDIIG